MPPKKDPGPSLFCEWVVGTTIPSVLGPIPKKRSKRDVIKVEVTTDEDTEEDSLKITYPRSSRTKKSSGRETKAKKVRFEEIPVKSAMRKTKAYTVSSESDLETSDTSTDASSDSSNPAKMFLMPDSHIRVHAAKVVETKPDTDSSSGADSGDESAPHPTCKCPGCIRGRQRLARRRKRFKAKAASSASETSESETDDSSKAKRQPDMKSKQKEKGKKQKAPESDDSDSGSAKESDQEESVSKATRKKQKNAVKNENAKNGGKGDKSDKGRRSGKEQSRKEKKAVKDSDKKKKRNRLKKDDEQHKLYPEATPGPHPRRPNLIEPIRAEVVQTERVVESPEDPPPNAYYDQKHNVLRVYHGPVYGGHPNHGLYPARDSSNCPLPVGAVHPTQNPYFYGFKNAPQHQHGMEHAPPHQGTHGGPWPGMYPSGYPPFVTGGPVQGGPPVQGDRPTFGSTKGAFSDKDRAGRNNVGPGSILVSASIAATLLTMANIFSPMASRIRITRGGPHSSLTTSHPPMEVDRGPRLGITTAHQVARVVLLRTAGTHKRTTTTRHGMIKHLRSKPGLPSTSSRPRITGQG